MKFEDHEIDVIWKIIASILHLGNIEYDDSKFTS
jgi:myosin heavy subunit